MPEEHNTDSHKYEVTDAHELGIVITGVGLAIMALVGFLVGGIILVWYADRDTASNYEPTPLVEQHEAWGDKARLQTDMAGDFVALRAAQDHTIETYGEQAKVNEDLTIYRMPIERAMHLVAEGGFPKFEPLNEAAANGESTSGNTEGNH